MWRRGLGAPAKPAPILLFLYLFIIRLSVCCVPVLFGYGRMCLYMKVSIKSLGEMEEFAKGFMEDVVGGLEVGGAGRAGATNALVIGLQGELGAGKTTFTKAVAKVLGVRDVVTSPTFVIEKIYKLSINEIGSRLFSRLIHIDAYRLESSDELLAIGWEEIIKDKENLILIEWPEKVESVLSKNIHTMKFKFIDESTREVEY